MQNVHKNSILTEIQKRGIKNLIHFTATSNINSILQNGILSKEALIKKKINFDYNDKMRLEGLPNSISLSIEFPNYSMFSRYRIYNQPPKDMAIIQISPQVLLEKNCAFYHNNAASGDFNNVNSQSLKNYDAWSAMFIENYKGINRAELSIPPNYTTHPQAEVLCFDEIELKYIKGITFETQQHFDKNFNDHGYPLWPHEKSMYLLNSSYYSAREDYQYWKK